MLTVGCSTQIYLYRGVTDMRKSFNGLSKLVQEYFPGQLLGDAWFIFVNRRRNRLKILLWDDDGFVIWFKHLQKGCFLLPDNDAKNSLQRREFLALIEGVVPLKFTPRFSLKNS